MTTRATTFVVLLPILSWAGTAQEVQYEPRWESLDARPMPPWFEEARFGVFVVWGPYSVPAWAPKGQYAEWYGHRMRQKDSPTARFHARVYGEDFPYERFAEDFTAELWDPEAWAELFARSGARYVVFMANYHDGFCLWPSSLSPGWNSVDVGPKRDLLGEMGEAVRARGMKMGLYYSLYEWFHPLWLSDRDRFVAEHFHPQFKDVVSNYRPSVIFADGEWEASDEEWRSEELLAWLFNESPVREEIVVNDRWGQVRGQHGSYYESEYGGGSMGPSHPWQEDRGMGRSYGYNRNEGIDEYDSVGAMIRMLVRCAAGGGNYLPCVGPTADGRIPVIMQERLLQIGAWLEVNGEAIYGSRASPFWPRQMDWGFVTCKPGRIYLHVCDPTAGEVELRGLRNEVEAAYFLADAAQRILPVRRAGRRVTVDLPEHLPDPEVSVVVLEVEGEPDVDRRVHPEADGSMVLRAREAEIHGPTPRYESGGGKDNIGYWGDPADSVSWKIVLERGGDYDVEVTYSCATGAAGSAFDVLVGERSVPGETTETGAWNRFERFPLGRIEIAPGEHLLRVQPRHEPPWHSMGLQAVALSPAGS